MVNVTEKKVKSASQESRKMLLLASEQLVEHKHHLKETYRQVVLHAAHDLPKWDRLVDGIRLAVVSRDDRIREADGRPTISVIYEYPDELYEYLAGSDAPSELKESLAGGLSINPGE